MKQTSYILDLAKADELTDQEVQQIFDRANGLPDTAAAVQLYSEWAGIYDQTVTRFGDYLTPQIAAAAIAELLPDPTIRVLDAACGSGLFGKSLSELGYSAIDGVDITPAMLVKAAEKNCYQGLTIADICDVLPLPPSHFDVVACIGAFTVGHVGVKAVPNLLSVLKPGGVLYCDVEHSWWTDRQFGRMFETLLVEGKLKSLNLKCGHCYAPAKNEPTHAFFVTACKS